MNKMFKKIVATTAVVSTVACLSVSAFAATANYAAGTNSVAVTLGTDEALTTGAQYTIIVVPANWNPSVDGADEQIYYINQGAAGGQNGEFETILADAALKDGIPNGTYQVRFGTDAATGIATAEFTIGDDGISVKWGDIDGNGYLESADVLYALRGSVQLYDDVTVKDLTEASKTISATVGDTLNVSDDSNNTVSVKLGDIDGNGYIESADVLYILRGSVQLYDDVTVKDLTDASKTISTSVGSALKISAAE